MLNQKTKNKAYAKSLHEHEKDRQQGNIQSIQDMSLLKAQYLEYVLLDNNHLVAALSSTGINMELFNEYEQTNIFEDYASFLTSHFSGNSTNTSIQTLDMTVPVDWKPYLTAWKSRLLKAQKENDQIKQHLISSYIEHYENFRDKSEMTTKKHIIVISEKIKDDAIDSLEMAAKNLDERVEELKRSLESTFIDYDVMVRRLNASEYKDILYWFMNFNHR